MNPVLRKDLLNLLRLPRVAAIQIAFVAVLAFMVLTSWPQGGVLAVAAQGRDDLLLGIVIGQLVLLTLFVPGIAATAISGERDGNTFEMLYASRLSAGQIVIGKILSAISFPVLLIIAGLPFVALLVWRGDVNVENLLYSYIILIVAAIFLAMVSLTVSAFSRQTSNALVISYVAVLVLCGGVLVPAALVLRETSGPFASLLHYARALSPVAAALSVLRPDAGGAQFGGRPDEGLVPIWQAFVPLALIVTAVCFAAIVAKLRKPPAESDRMPGGAIAVENRSIGRKVMFLIDDKKQRKPLGSFNPIMGKENRTNALRSGRWMIRSFYASLVLSLGLAVMSLYGGVEQTNLLAHVATVLVALQLGLIALIDPSLTSPGISSEIESGTFETLRLTPLGGGKIFWGKLLPSLPAALLPVLALLPAYGAVCFVDPSYPQRFLLLLPVVALAALLCCTVGLAASSFFDNTARATVTAYLICAAIFILPLLPYFAAGTQLGENIAAWMSMVSPLVMGLSLMPTGSRAVQELWQTHLIVIACLCLVMLLAARVRLGQLLKQG
ncbi:MAG TPA: ABC transporter permease [Tepidisphaeraceae bacterium]|jgi:ABC-type transport system involved in multi-copper enzyme maturation permease subunit|nr:ABC transporter permease [Tepidisphaeraceae bacterium]